MLSIRELIELAKAGEAAKFTDSIQEALSETASDAVSQAAEWPEDEDEEEFDVEDDIEDLPPEDDVDDLDEEELDERNALNHQKARAFRSGKKMTQVKGMPTTKYMDSRERRWYPDRARAADNEVKQKKELAGAKAKSMHADATEKGIKLGGKSRQFVKARDAGIQYKKDNPHDRPSGKVFSNADDKEMLGQGKYLHKHLGRQHREMKDKIRDLHREISNALYKHQGDEKEKYGDEWRFSRDKNKEPSLQTKHIEALKHLHKKLQNIHHVVSSMDEEVLDWDVIAEDYLEVEDEYTEILQDLQEGKTYKANADDDYRSHRKQSYLRRRDRKMKAEEVEEVELFSLRDDLTDEELQEIVDTITEEHFEMLDELSKKTLGNYVFKAGIQAYTHGVQAGKNLDNPKGPDFNKATKTASKRLAGIATVSKKLAREEVEDLDELNYSAKKAAAGKDIGKKGKNFSKIAAGAAKEYGSKEAGDRVAGAILNKLRHRGK